MGLVVNKRLEDIGLEDLLDELEIEAGNACADMPVHFGGPVESGRGFVLHTADYEVDGTLDVAGNIALTSSIDVLRAIAHGRGPSKSLLVLGYAGWGPGQLETEIQENGWLHVSADELILFGRENGAKWRQAMAKLGIDLSVLSSTAGRA
jgi:putative transcriptional regulator